MAQKKVKKLYRALKFLYKLQPIKRKFNLGIYTLSGGLGVLLTPSCTLSCKGCTYLDYLNEGCTVKKPLSLNDIKKIVNFFLSSKIRIQNLTILGGEPTLHHEYLEIIKYLYSFKGTIYYNLQVDTNGTFIQQDFIKSLDYVDSVRLSIYPNTKEILSQLKSTGLLKFMESKCEVRVYENSSFLQYGKKIDGLAYSQKLNWDRCHSLKQHCRIIDTKAIYRCPISYNHKKEYCLLSESRSNIIKYIENNSQPLDLCEKCPMPCQTAPCISKNNEKDLKATSNGLAFIKGWKLNNSFHISDH